jgi:hypothetical protein
MRPIAEDEPPRAAGDVQHLRSVFVTTVHALCTRAARSR